MIRIVLILYALFVFFVYAPAVAWIGASGPFFDGRESHYGGKPAPGWFTSYPRVEKSVAALKWMLSLAGGILLVIGRRSAYMALLLYSMLTLAWIVTNITLTAMVISDLTLPAALESTYWGNLWAATAWQTVAMAFHGFASRLCYRHHAALGERSSISQ